MSLNRLNGWQRLALVLSAIYWVSVVAAGAQWGFEVGSYVPQSAEARARYDAAVADVAGPLEGQSQSAEAFLNAKPSAPPRPPPEPPVQFAWAPFWLAMGLGVIAYAAVAALIWAGLGFRKRQEVGNG